ncbi:MAG: DUF4199 domain-containing protein [Bacteroidaceae bacterium]|nr:DUF4199 domain-containing protein [Bacteroidaceae bacterium]
MVENRNNLQRASMLAGTIMGVFWIIKFIFFPLGMSTPVFMMVFGLLTMFVPFLGYRMAQSYRNKFANHNGSIGFIHAFTFCLFMYMYASLLTSVGHLIYFQFIDNGFILEKLQDMFDTVKESSLPGMDTYIQQYQLAIDTYAIMSPVDITLQLVSQNMFYGLLMALPTALIVKKKNYIENE